MASKIQLKRGTQEELNQNPLDEGEIGFTLDTKKLYVGDTEFSSSQEVEDAIAVALNEAENGLNAVVDEIVPNMISNQIEPLKDEHNSILEELKSEITQKTEDIQDRFNIVIKNITGLTSNLSQYVTTRTLILKLKGKADKKHNHPEYLKQGDLEPLEDKIKKAIKEIRKSPQTIKDNGIQFAQLNHRHKIPDILGLQDALNNSSGGQPAGVTGQVQYNNEDTFAADDGLTYDPATDTLSVIGQVTTNTVDASEIVASTSIGTVNLSATGVTDIAGDLLLNTDSGSSGEVLTSNGIGVPPTWETPSGGGDMLAATYDPQAIAADVFDQDNMINGTTNKNYTVTEQTKLTGVESLADVTDAGNVGSSIHGATGKTTPVDDDTMPLIDSAALNVLKKVTWANIKATIKTYYDSVSSTLTNKDLTSGTNTFPTLNQSTTGSAATLTTPRAIYGNNFDGSTALTQIIASTFGGTGNGFTKFTGPATSERTFTLPNATSTILTSNAAVTVAQGGTGRDTGTTAYSLLATGTTATGTQQTLANGATTEVLVGGGVSALPVWTTATGSGAPVRANSPALVTPTGIVKGDVGLGNVDNTSNATERAATRTLTNARINPRVVSAASYTTDTGSSLDVSTADQFIVTAQAGALKFNNPSGTPTEGQKLMIRIKDNGTARALTYDTQFRASSDLALPTTTVLSKTLYMGFVFNSTDTRWDLLCVLNNF